MDILLIAGMWLDASVWAETAGRLERHGHRPVPVSLPGQGDGNTAATLADQVAAVTAAVDAADDAPLVVGHSAASGLAWLAADARPDAVAGVVMIGGFPGQDGDTYFDAFPVTDGVVPFPGWEPFEGPDVADLDDAARARLAARAVAVPAGVTTAPVALTDERRYDVPLTLVCPEFTPDDVREWVRGGHLPELARARNVSYVDIDSGHWPMISRSRELADLLADIADRS